MTPLFEQVTIPSGHSWGLLWRELETIPFIWHYHPQFELTLTVNARGQRYIGDHLGDFEPGDLVLVGPNLPHTWSAHERLDSAQPMLAVVVWFAPEWITQLAAFPELRSLRQLAARAGPALHFSPATSARCAERLLQLQVLPAPQRLPLLLDVLLMLAEDGKAQALASMAQTAINIDSQQKRMEKVLDHMHTHFRDEIALEILAQQAALSLGAFHRFFKRHASCTPGAYLARLRIGRACQQLIESELSIAVIAQEAGYRNLAHFNRQFLATKRVTPRTFRRQYRHD
ncbi:MULTISPECIES: AraC family transcriptional regulator [unclassified Janthinobacterium]|uniref:helix-turn-helix domain-containing protein n=1 Tax=unclassified Janthinobacterium TaxID=2610881 RepID=UPI0016145626|nr:MULTISPECIES: AraC family transcriptional regulator [unclassified Janthinobacterium]MBB5368840.1 AraC-like DNA-binding protein [Janthinobacterium sp. K2C7]MBB5381624.1 AraC-like DNA-binding protein [Janthinobacterium sp. K2Li3]MBB5387222.1 AraC-like DNA-binding protein [Janthinobacterium sp. K2E3]